MNGLKLLSTMLLILLISPLYAGQEPVPAVIVGLAGTGSRTAITVLDDNARVTPDSRGIVAFRAKLSDASGLRTARIEVPGSAAQINAAGLKTVYVNAYWQTKSYADGATARVRVIGVDMAGNRSERTISVKLDK